MIVQVDYEQKRTPPKPGEAFVFNGDTYMRVQSPDGEKATIYNAVNLHNGILKSFLWQSAWGEVVTAVVSRVSTGED
jgi:hypothetical protein